MRDVFDAVLAGARDEALTMSFDPTITASERRDNAVRAETFHRVLEWRFITNPVTDRETSRPQ